MNTFTFYFTCDWCNTLNDSTEESLMSIQSVQVCLGGGSMLVPNAPVLTQRETATQAFVLTTKVIHSLAHVL